MSTPRAWRPARRRSGGAPREGAAGAPAHVSRVGSGRRRGRPLSPRKEPRQERALRTRDAILDAAASSFALAGHAGTTTNRVAERAGVSIGSLYQYFPNKDAILAALYERHLVAVDAAFDRALADLDDPQVPLSRALLSLLERLREIHEAEPKLTAAVSLSDHLPRIGAPGRRREERYAQRVEAALRGRPDVRPGDPALMARLLVVVAKQLIRWSMHELPPAQDRRVVNAEIARMLARYLER